MRTKNLLAFAALAGPAAAQSFLFLPVSGAPAQQELGSFRIVPLMRPSARVQMFYDATEVGAQAFTATRLSLRYDGPIPPVGAPGPFTIQRVQIRIGTTSVAIPGPEFAANLSQPLALAFDGRITYWPDQGTFGPEPWGGTNDTLSFPLAQPLAIAIPANGFFVVDLQIEGNDLNGQAHTMLDAARGSGGPADGMALSSGSGCAAASGGPNATIASSGVHAPGAVHSIHGSHLGSHAPVFAMIGGSDTAAAFGPLPLPVPGTACTVYTSWDLMLPLQADAAGTVAAFARGSTVPVPALPALQGARLYAQLVSYVPGVNSWNLVFSDKRSIVLGTLVAPNPGFYAVSHGFDANAPFADEVGPFGYALRIETR